VASWAQEVGYPLADTDNLTRVAQFLSVTTHDPAGAKTRYLQFLKERLIELAREESGTHQEHLDHTEDELPGLKFSELATARLSTPDFEKDVDHPLRILAGMPIPLYLTTSHHGFMEAALEVAGKPYRSEVYCWREYVKEVVPETCQPDFSLELDPDKPLIYHLHGLDHYPDSLVLTEDDHLEFLASVVREFDESKYTPNKVRTAITSSFLLLLGYELHAWDLSVLWHGILKPRERHYRGFAIQVDPDKVKDVTDYDTFRKYLKEYFGEAKIDVYWGTPQSFMITLRDKWGG
jgi:hypothetical protein